MGRQRNRNKVNAKGRNPTSRFARLDFRLLTSNAYRSLSPNARSLLVELAMLENGSNNGSLYLSVRDGAHRLGVADLTAASRAFDDLIALGFIEMTQDAYFRVKAANKSRARCWRLTWQSGPARKAPSWTFLNREPDPKTPARKRMERGQRALKAYRKAKDSGDLPVLDSDFEVHDAAPVAAASVMEFNTLNDRNGSIRPNPCIRDFATHSAVTIGKGPRSNLLGWWEPDWTPSLATLAFATSISTHWANEGNAA
tara:strand:+ start:7608 stop:8372 length:765 start_codon:yes stop_codon:yes gene_type:complete